MATGVAGVLQFVRVLSAEGKPRGVVISPSTEEPVRLHLLIRSWSQVHVKHLRGGRGRGRGLVHHRRHLEKNDDSMPNQCHFFMSAILLRIRITLLIPELLPIQSPRNTEKNKKTINKKEQKQEMYFYKNIYIYSV